jgi:putative ABC transport system permease protein
MAIAAVAFGATALLLGGGFIDWIFQNFREYSIRSHLGHIQVTRAEKDAGTAPLLPTAESDLQAISADPRVDLVAPRLSFSGFVSAGDATLSFVGEGVDPAKERRLSLSMTVSRGKDLDAADPNGLLLGDGLAANLGVKPGDAVVLLVAPSSGSVNAIEAHVRGTFFTVTKAYDDVAIRVPLAAAQRLMRVTGAQRWLVLLHDTRDTANVLASLRDRFRDRDLRFTPWWDLADFYNKTVKLFSRQLDVIKLVIAIIVALSISNTMMMSVLERTREIGTSMALGTPRSRILLQFVLEGAILGAIGGTLGLALGGALAAILSAIGIPMPPPPGMSHGFVGGILLGPSLLVDAWVLAVATTVIAALYPARRASRLPIVDALRQNR